MSGKGWHPVTRVVAVVAGLLGMAGVPRAGAGSPPVGAVCTPKRIAVVVQADGRHRQRNLSRWGRRARPVRRVELPGGGVLAIRATRNVPEETISWAADMLSRGIARLRHYLGPGPVDLEYVLVGRRRLPPAYWMKVRRRGGPQWISIGAAVFTVPRPGRPSWEDLATEIHEMVHDWMDYGEWFGGDGYPRWLEEGTADVVGKQVVQDLGGQVGDRAVPPPSTWRRGPRALLEWEQFRGNPRRMRHQPLDQGVEISRTYDMAYHLVREVWARDGGKTLVRLLREFAGRDEIPPPEEQERIFREVVGEPFPQFFERVAARVSAPGAPAGNTPPEPAAGRGHRDPAGGAIR